MKLVGVALLGLASAFLASCGGSSPTEPPPPSQKVGTVKATLKTTGSDLDPDGYQVDVDGKVTKAVSDSGTATFQDVAAGQHDVTLKGIAANCAVQGDNPRTIDVTAGSEERRVGKEC